MHNIYDAILDPILTLAYLAAGTAGVQITKLSVLLGAFSFACNTAEHLVVGIASTLLRAAM